MTSAVGARYFFPAMLTFDKSLIEVMRLFQLKACALAPADGTPIPVFAGDWISEMASGDKNTSETIAKKYFSDAARIRRSEMRDNGRDFLVQLAAQLEKRVAKLAKIAAP